MAPMRHVIGVAKRAIKPGEPIEFRIRDDGFAESDDLRFRSGMAFVDLLVVNGTKTAGQESPEKEASHG